MLKILPRHFFRKSDRIRTNRRTEKCEGKMIKKEDKDFVRLETTLDPKTNAVTEAALIAEPSPAARKPRRNVKGSSTDSDPATQASGTPDCTNTSSARRRRATGPRTCAGKARSRRNSLKSGIFAHIVHVPGESPAGQNALLLGFRRYFRPEGTVEDSLVEDLAYIVTRQKRIRTAETAEIVKAQDCCVLDEVTEEWGLWRDEDQRGILRNSHNTILLLKARLSLQQFRNAFAKVGFSKPFDPPLLRKLYGNRDGNTDPWSLYGVFCLLSAWAHPLNGTENSEKLEGLKQTMLGLLDDEILRLKKHLKLQADWNERRAVTDKMAALVPSNEAMDRIIRYEAHLSR